MFILKDPRKRLEEALRILTPHHGGGIIALTSWKRSDWLAAAELLEVANPEVALPEMPERWSSVEGLREQFDESGFRDVEATRWRSLRWRCTFGSQMMLCGRLCRCRVFRV